MIWKSGSIDRRRFLKMAVGSGAALGAAPMAGALLAACGTSTATGGNSVGQHPAQTVHLGDTVTPPNPEFTAEEFFRDRLHSLTNQEYTVLLHPNSQLGSAQQMLDQMVSGQLQFNKGNTGQMNQLLPQIDAWNLPYAFADNNKLIAAEHGAMGHKTDELLQAKGIKVLAWFDGGTRNVFSKTRAVHEPADMKGLKIRVTGPGPLADLFNGLGATAVPLPSSGIYSGLQTGVVDTAENNVPFFVTQKLDEVTKYFSWTKHSFSIDPLVVSLSWFNQQPKDLQDAILKAANDTEDYERQQWAVGDKSGMKVATDAGIVFNDADTAAFQKSDVVQKAWTTQGPKFEPLFTLLQQAQ